MMRTSVLVAGVMGAMGATAGAGIVTYGAEVFTTGSAPADDRNDSDFGAGPGTYDADLLGFASSSLVWGNASWLFSGTATGGSGVFATSKATAIYVFTEAMTVAGSWDFSGVDGTSTSVGWAFFDSLGNEIFAIQVDGTNAPVTTGGVSASRVGSFSGTIAAGTYVMSTLAENSDEGGAFSSAITFTPVPAPGALPLVAIASIAARRGRRR
jgi:hypothetical protein